MDTGTERRAGARGGAIDLFPGARGTEGAGEHDAAAEHHAKPMRNLERNGELLLDQDPGFLTSAAGAP